MATAWTYGDWETTTTAGSQARLTRLQQHIKEVADALLEPQTVNYPGGKTHVHAALTEYLASLRKIALTLEARIEAVNGTRVGFTRGRAIP